MISQTLSKACLLTQPFEHFSAEVALTDEHSLALLEWLEKQAPWHLTKAEFYEQYEFSLCEEAVPASLRDSIQSSLAEPIRMIVGESFGVQLARKIDVTFHKLVSEQRIRIHNDHIPGAETHRVLIQLNRGWSDRMGGLLMFFKSEAPEDISLIFRPTHNSCVAFAISPRSFHAVSMINSGERYTMVFSFFKK